MPWDPYFMAGDSVGVVFTHMNPKQKITFHYYPCTGEKDNLGYPQQKKKKKTSADHAGN